MTWTKTTLGEICKMYQPKTISTKKMVSNGAYPVFGANGIIGRYDKYNHKEPQLLITCRGATCGSINISKSFSWINGNAMVIQPDLDRVSLRFMEYLFRGGINLKKAITGSAQPQITRKSLEKISFAFPSLDEQISIVKKLDNYFSAIDISEKILENKLKKLSTFFNSYVEEKLQNLKNNFPIVQLDEVIESVQYGTGEKCSKEGDYPVLRMGNMQNGKFYLDDLVYSNKKIDSEKFLVKKFDVFFNRTNSVKHVGKSAIWEGQENVLFAGYLIRINYDKSKVDPYFLNFFLNTESTRKYGYRVMSESINQANINGTKLKKYPFIRADLDAQKKLSSKFLALEKKLSEALNLTKQSLELYGKLKERILSEELQKET